MLYKKLDVEFKDLQRFLQDIDFAMQAIVILDNKSPENIIKEIQTIKKIILKEVGGFEMTMRVDPNKNKL